MDIQIIMKKIIILAIALLSTGIIFAAINNKKEVAKPIVVKVQKGDFATKTTGNINSDALASAD